MMISSMRVEHLHSALRKITIFLLVSSLIACATLGGEPKAGVHSEHEADAATPGESLALSAEKSRNQIVDVLVEADIDLWELPELSRVLNPMSALPMEDLARRRLEVLNSLPTIIPSDGWISSTFGARKSKFDRAESFHKGIDIAGREGTPIYAPADGVVRFSGKFGRFGNYLSLVHGMGIVTKYAHSATLAVKAGQMVKRGDLIATMGSTGRSTGTHLHYEVWINDQAVNPARFMAGGKLITSPGEEVASSH